MKPLLLSLVTSIILPFLADAMPTAEEIAAAEPLVQEVMKAEMDALRSGKKTREQVGDAAVALAKAAQAPAEKYILLTGAFDYYMRGGAYDKAASALEAVRKAIPDWKGSDEFALIDKAMRVVAFGKGGPVRERYEELKERQQYASRLKKALAQAKAKPSDKKLQFQVATYSAALGHWPHAVDAFLAANNPACADAAKLEKESAPPAKIADAWWSVVDIRPAFLSSAIRAHAVDLYKKAIAANSLAGLQRVAAEKRIAEYESSLAASESPGTTAKSFSSSSPSVGTAKYYGVELVGNSIKESRGILSGFSDKSYAKIKAPFAPRENPFEVVVEFTTGRTIDTFCGILVGLGAKNGFSPLFVSNSNIYGYLSSDGKNWNIANGMPIGILLKPNTKYLVRCSWDGSLYSWEVKDGDKWHKTAEVKSKLPILSMELQLGTNRGIRDPFSGVIDLNKSYISVNGKVLWEGVKGAYRNVANDMRGND